MRHKTIVCCLIFGLMPAVPAVRAASARDGVGNVNFDSSLTIESEALPWLP